MQEVIFYEHIQELKLKKKSFKVKVKEIIVSEYIFTHCKTAAIWNSMYCLEKSVILLIYLADILYLNTKEQEYIHSTDETKISFLNLFLIF